MCIRDRVGPAGAVGMVAKNERNYGRKHIADHCDAIVSGGTGTWEMCIRDSYCIGTAIGLALRRIGGTPLTVWHIIWLDGITPVSYTHLSCKGGSCKKFRYSKASSATCPRRGRTNWKKG